VATRTDPLQKSVLHEYDKADNLKQVTDRKGQVTTYQYDELNRLSQATFQDTSTISYTYDAGDRLIQIADSANGTITRDYDGLNRLKQEVTPEGTVNYTYDADGRRATMTVFGQPQVTYGYDDAHRLTSITQGTGVVSITYDNANRRSTLTYPNGILATYGYDDANQLTSLTYTLGQTTVGNLTYTYDAAGQRTTVGGSWARTGLPQALSSATYDAANRIATWAGQIFSYDANGNLASDGLTTYTWNARDQLSALAGATSGVFQYDGVGRRRAKTTTGTTSFLYDGPNVVQELAGGTPVTNLLSGGVDEIFQRTDASGARILLTDALGSALALADNTGTTQTQYTYEPFGATSASGSTSGNAIQYTGRENDGTGLYYVRARFYGPASARFIREDQLGFLGGDVNFYTYVFANPINYTDPFGLSVLVFCTDLGTLTMFDDAGNEIGTFPAANNAQSSSKGPWPPGIYPYLTHTTHANDAPNSEFGTNGNFQFKVPGRPGMGIHSGRRDVRDKRNKKGPEHATNGCIRTTDEGTEAINEINEADPLRRLIVGPCGE
jgi:RHS repeat-associated protein